MNPQTPKNTFIINADDDDSENDGPNYSQMCSSDDDGDEDGYRPSIHLPPRRGTPHPFGGMRTSTPASPPSPPQNHDEGYGFNSFHGMTQSFGMIGVVHPTQVVPPPPPPPNMVLTPLPSNSSAAVRHMLTPPSAPATQLLTQPHPGMHHQLNEFDYMEMLNQINTYLFDIIRYNQEVMQKLM